MSQIADLSRSTIPMRQTEHDAFLRQIKPMVTEEKRQATNIIMILMDDLGWGDLSCLAPRPSGHPISTGWQMRVSSWKTATAPARSVHPAVSDC